MIKYFIEAADGSWLTDPELWFEGQPAFTKDPFKAWMFDTMDNIAWGEDVYKDSGQWIVYNMRKEGLMGDYKVIEQEFSEHPEGVLSYTWRTKDQINYLVERYSTGMNIIKEGHVSFVHHPAWDGSIEKFLR